MKIVLEIVQLKKTKGSWAAFEILVVRAPGTTKKVAGQPKILMQLFDGQPSILTPQL